MSIKPRLIASIAQLENNPLCLAYAGRLTSRACYAFEEFINVSLTANYDEDGDLILFGDDGGYVNVLHITRKFLFDSSSDSETSEQLTPAKLLKRDSAKKNNLSFYRVCFGYQLIAIFYLTIAVFFSTTEEDPQ
jgi:hypothetical protein